MYGNTLRHDFQKTCPVAHAACVLRGKNYVVGGLGPNGKAVKEIECFDPANNKWSIVETVNGELFRHALVAV